MDKVFEELEEVKQQRATAEENCNELKVKFKKAVKMSFCVQLAYVQTMKSKVEPNVRIRPNSLSSYAVDGAKILAHDIMYSLFDIAETYNFSVDKPEVFLHT